MKKKSVVSEKALHSLYAFVHKAASIVTVNCREKRLLMLTLLFFIK